MVVAALTQCWTLAITLSTELDELFIERVHVLLQLPFLLLHILQVLSQRLDFSLMLQTEQETSHQ